jgi:hypothetical protein
MLEFAAGAGAKAVAVECVGVWARVGILKAVWIVFAGSLTLSYFALLRLCLLSSKALCSCCAVCGCVFGVLTCSRQKLVNMRAASMQVVACGFCGCGVRCSVMRCGESHCLRRHFTQEMRCGCC